MDQPESTEIADAFFQKYFCSRDSSSDASGSRSPVQPESEPYPMPSPPPPAPEVQPTPAKKKRSSRSKKAIERFLLSSIASEKTESSLPSQRKFPVGTGAANKGKNYSKRQMDEIVERLTRRSNTPIQTFSSTRRLTGRQVSLVLLMLTL